MMPQKFLSKVNGLLDENSGEANFGIAELCRELDISRTQLHRKIKAATGQSASHFIRSFRLGKAKELLETTNESVSKVAKQVGFRTPTYFATAFMKEFGCQPSSLRRE